jgi:hypothetical protein
MHFEAQGRTLKAPASFPVMKQPWMLSSAHMPELGSLLTWPTCFQSSFVTPLAAFFLPSLLFHSPQSQPSPNPHHQ